eukprot:16443462-Heterocapsa_arctica.AAC.1
MPDITATAPTQLGDHACRYASHSQEPTMVGRPAATHTEAARGHFSLHTEQLCDVSRFGWR